MTYRLLDLGILLAVFGPLAVKWTLDGRREEHESEDRCTEPS